MQETDCPLYPSVSSGQSEEGQPPSESTQDEAQARQVQGLMQYTRQTLQQYTNGATLRGMTTKQERAVKQMNSSTVATNTELPGVTGEQKISPQTVSYTHLTLPTILLV